MLWSFEMVSHLIYIITDWKNIPLVEVRVPIITEKIGEYKQNPIDILKVIVHNKRTITVFVVTKANLSDNE